MVNRRRDQRHVYRTIQSRQAPGHSEPALRHARHLATDSPTLTVSPMTPNMPAKRHVLGGNAGRTFDPVPCRSD